MPIVGDIDRYIEETTMKKPAPTIDVKTPPEVEAMPEGGTPPPAKLPATRAPRAGAVALTPMEMIGQALASGASVEVLDKMLALQVRWEANEARKAFDAAMADARAEIQPILKTRTADRSGSSGKGGSYLYEDMADVAEVIDPVLGKYGLNYRFKSTQDKGVLTVTCVLSHRDGHREDGATLQAGIDESGNKPAIQGLGSSATYLERYTVKLSLGLAAGKDTDATPIKHVPGMEPITDEHYDELLKLMEARGETPARLLAFLGLHVELGLRELTEANFKKAKMALTAPLKEATSGAAQS